MHPALKLNLDGFEFRNHSLLRSDPPYGEGSALVALPTIGVKPRKVRVSGLPCPRCFRFRAANRPNSISRVLSGCNSKPNFASRSRNSFRKRSASCPVLTRLASGQRGRLHPGFQRFGRPRRRRISLQCQLGNLHWQDSHLPDHHELHCTIPAHSGLPVTREPDSDTRVGFRRFVIRSCRKDRCLFLSFRE